MRKTTLLLVVMGILLMIGAGVALAANTTGTNQAETLNGTSGPDKLAGGGGADTLIGKQGDDLLFGDWGGNDKLNGGPDSDFLNAADGAGGDTLNPGSTFTTGSDNDTCVADVGDSAQGDPSPPLDANDDGNQVGDCETVTIVH